MKKKYNIIAICGKAGSGKDTLLNELSKKHPEANKIVNFTSRPKRDYEIEGIDYYFISRNEFIKKIENRETIDHTSFNDWFFGMTFDCLEKDKINIGVFNPTSIKNLLLYEDSINLFVYFLNVDDKIRLIRQLEREENPDVKEIIRRYSGDEL